MIIGILITVCLLAAVLGALQYLTRQVVVLNTNLANHHKHWKQTKRHNDRLRARIAYMTLKKTLGV